MAVPKCPGQDLRFWKPEDIFEAPCPHCGTGIEFWKDDPARTCSGCGQRVKNPKIDTGCAEWCKYAEECLGVKPGSQVDLSVREALIEEMKTAVEGDESRIRDTLHVLDHAEQIMDAEGGDPFVVTAAAILHDVGAGAAEEDAAAAALQGILEKLDADEGRIELVSQVIAGVRAGQGDDTLEMRILSDAIQLVKVPDAGVDRSEEELHQYIKETFCTETGRTIAKRTFAA